MPNVTIDDFARSFGTTPSEFSNVCLENINKHDFSYKLLAKKSRDGVILEVLKKISGDTQIIGAKERTAAWENGWAENLEAFKASNFDLDTLVPKFIRANQPIRYNGDYIIPRNSRFEYDYMTVFRIWLFQKYFSDYSTIYEFGCGSGLNLVLLASLMPDKKLFGLDFVQSSVELMNRIGQTHNWPLSGCHFDMIKPDESFRLSKGSAVLTFGALEQVAGKFESFIQYLLKQKIGICVHVEPTIELYDETKLFDYLAVQFHRKRGYTENLLPYIQRLETEKKVKILQIKRLYFGSLFMEGYTYFVWQPLSGE